MLALMLDLRFKSLLLVTNYVGRKIASTLEAQYCEQFVDALADSML